MVARTIWVLASSGVNTLKERRENKRMLGNSKCWLLQFLIMRGCIGVIQGSGFKVDRVMQGMYWKYMIIPITEDQM